MFKGRHFDRSISLLCVRWYLAYNLSLRDLEEMMAERGITVDHSTVNRWVRYLVCDTTKTAGSLRLQSRSLARGTVRQNRRLKSVK